MGNTTSPNFLFTNSVFSEFLVLTFVSVSTDVSDFEQVQLFLKSKYICIIYGAFNSEMHKLEAVEIYTSVIILINLLLL